MMKPAPLSRASGIISAIGATAAHIVDDRRAGIERRARDAGFHRVDRDQRRRPRARSFSITGTTRASSSSPRTSSAPGRVDSPPTSMISRAFGDHPRPLLDRGIAIEKLPAVGKRIRRDIQHAHDHRAGRRSRSCWPAIFQSTAAMRLQTITREALFDASRASVESPPAHRTRDPDL